MANKWEATPFKSPSARAEGLGSAHNGLNHWIVQRITSVALIPLSLWAIWSVMTLAGAGMGYETVRAFLAQPLNAILMLLFLIATFYHAALGMQVVIEDYIHTNASKMLIVITTNLALFALCIACIFSVLKLAL